MVKRTFRIRMDTLINESERIIKEYFNREIIKKILSEESVDEQLSIVEDYLKSSHLDSLWNFFQAYRGQFIDFISVMRNTFPEIEEELTTKKLGIKTFRPKRKPKRIKIVKGKKYSKAEVLFIKNRVNMRSNVKLQKEHSEFFGFQRPVSSISSAKSKIKKGKLK